MLATLLLKGSAFHTKPRSQPYKSRYTLLESDVDRVKLFRLTLRFFFDDVSMASYFIFSIPTSNFSTTHQNFQSLLYMFIFSSKFMLIFLHFSIGTRAVVISSTVLLSSFCFLVKLLCLCIGPVLWWFRLYLISQSQHARRNTFQTCILNLY